MGLHKARSQKWLHARRVARRNRATKSRPLCRHDFQLLAEITRLDRPTRLADGLGLESTLVQTSLNLRPGNRRTTVLIWVPRCRVWQRGIRLYTVIIPDFLAVRAADFELGRNHLSPQQIKPMASNMLRFSLLLAGSGFSASRLHPML